MKDICWPLFDAAVTQFDNSFDFVLYVVMNKIGLPNLLA